MKKNELTIRSLKTFLILALISFITSCNEQIEEPQLQSTTTTTYKQDVNASKINPIAVTYYKNIASIAKWYAKHPKKLQKEKLKSLNQNADSVNTIVEKLLDIEIIDSLGQSTTVFELQPAELDTFLNTFVIIESNELSKKLALDTTTQSNVYFSDINNSYVPETTTKSEDINYDPYWSTIKKVKAIEQKRAMQNQSVAHSNLKSADDNFWKEVMANQLLALSIVHTVRPTLEPATFVNRIKGSIQRGRLLIALPGGFSGAFYPIVFYPASNFYDVGHVAIFSKNSNDIIGEISDNYKITIGTDKEFGMRDEGIGVDWSRLHGIAYVGQVYDVKWRWFRKNWHHWGFRLESSDVDNEQMYQQALAQANRNTPYIRWYEVLTAKWAAPERLMCSTSAWWAAKKAADVNISDWWKTTILPAGVLYSDRVRIVDTTLN